MKGALNAPDKSGRFRLASANRRDRLRDRHCETLLRHEGLAPVRLSKGSTPDRALLRTNFLPDIGSIGLSIPRPSGRGVEDSLFRAIRLAADRSAQMASNRPRSKRRQPFACLTRLEPE